MPDLQLSPGPRLLQKYWKAGSASSKAEWAERDVTRLAHEYLFAEVDVRADVTLQDFFGLFNRSEVLRQVYRQDFAESLCGEAQKGPISPDWEEPEQIEYLELYQAWRLDTYTGEVSGAGEFLLQGVGPVLSQDVKEEGPGYVHHKAGSRIPWGVSLTSVRKMLLLPLRVNQEVLVFEADCASLQFGREIRKHLNKGITLGTFIQSVLRGLSWHGGPEQTREVLAEVKVRIESAQTGAKQTVTADYFFEKMFSVYAGAYEKHFKARGGRSGYQLYVMVSQLSDDDNIQEALSEASAGEVQVQDNLAHLTCRAFRREDFASRGKAMG